MPTGFLSLWALVLVSGQKVGDGLCPVSGLTHWALNVDEEGMFFRYVRLGENSIWVLS